jgi:hypothetical protein
MEETFFLLCVNLIKHAILLLYKRIFFILGCAEEKLLQKLWAYTRLK